MANSDKNILITPNVGAATGTYPTIKFNGANNTPVNLTVLDDGTVSFSGTAGQLFSISDGLTGTIFSVNDISGIPSIEVLDTGLIKLAQYSGSTVIAGSSAIQNASSVNAKLSIYTAAAANPGLVIKGAVSQTANLQEWQDSAGNVIARVASTGQLLAPSYVGNNFQITSAGALTVGTSVSQSNIQALILSTAITNVGLIVKGTTSQTADLQQWQDSNGNIYALINPYGQLSIGVNPTIYSNARISINTVAATVVGQVIRGVASQTANLQEWQDSSGTPLTWVDSSGSISMPRTGTFRFNGGVGVNRAYITSNTNNDLIFATAAGTEAFRLYGGAAPNGALLTIGTASAVGLVIKGAVSQTANLQEWQDSAGTAVAYVTSGGAIQGGTYNGVIIGLSYPGIVLDTGNSANSQVWLRNTSASTSSGIFAGIKARPSYADAVSGDDLVTLSGQEYQGGYSYESGKILISSDGTPSSSSRPARITFHTIASGSTTLTERMRIGNSGTVTINGFDSASTGLIVKGAASQTADLQQWQNSAGTILSNIDSSGSMYLPFLWSSSVRFGDRYNWSGSSTINILNASNIPGIIIRAYGPQTADLQQWQNNSGTVLAAMKSNGSLYLASIVDSAGTGAVLQPQAAAGFLLTTRTSTNTGLIIKGTASQTADLQQWQDSSGTILAKIAANGSPTFASPIVGFVGTSGSYSSTAVSGYNIIHLSQGMIFINSQTGGDYNLATNTYYNSGWKYFENAGSTLINFGNGRFDFNTASSGTAGNAITYTSKMMIANSGTVTINGFSASDKGLIVKGAASQTGDLQQWQNSAGSVVARIDAYGTFQNGTGSGYGAWINVQPGLASDKGIVVRGAASQTANLQEWQNSSGTVLAYIASNGYINTGASLSVTGAIMAYGGGLIVASGPAATALTVKGVASQTGDLQQWQNSNNAVIASIGTSSASFMGTSAVSLYNVGINASAHSNIMLQVGSTGWTSFNTSNQTAGIYTRHVNLGTGDMVGIYSQPVTGNSHSNVWSIGAHVRSAGGASAVITQAYNFYAYSPTMSSGTITNLYGLFINTQKATNVTNAYGIYQAGVDDLNIINGRTTFNAGATTYVPLIVKGIASQSANLQEWQDSSGTVLAKVDSNGKVSVNIGLYSYTAPTFTIGDAAYGLSAEGGYLRHYTAAVSTGGHIWYGGSNNSIIRAVVGNNGGFSLRGIASQTADLQQWQNSAGTVLAKIDANGDMTLSGASGIANLLVGTDGNTTFRTAGLVGLGTQYASSSNQVQIFTTSTSRTGLMIQGMSGQTGNLQEWQNNSGTVLTKIKSDGSIDLVSGGSISAYYFTKAGGSTVMITLTGNDNIVLGNNSGVSGLSGTNNIFITNSSSVPSSNPSGGGALYVENGALKYRGTSGTVTTIANA